VMFAVLTRRAWLGVLLAFTLWTSMGYLSRSEGRLWPLAWEAATSGMTEDLLTPF